MQFRHENAISLDFGSRVQRPSPPSPPPAPPPMDLLSYFDLSTPTFPFAGSKPTEIEHRRALMSDLLIYDILLQHGGIRSPHALWPPHTPAGLEQLLDAIQSSSYDSLKNDCLVYFLLKWYCDGRETGFAEDAAIPPQFVALTDAYWHLDSGVDVQRAVHLLSDRRVNREHSSKIIQALSLSPKSTADTLVVQFVQVVKPVLVEPPEIEAYGLALARTDFNAAWGYQRAFEEGSETRNILLRRIVQSCLAPVNQTQIMALYTVPFTPYEQSTVESLALSSSQSELPTSAQSILADLLVARLIQSGQLAKAVLMDRKLRSAPGVPPPSETRRAMVDDALACLPAVEKMVLDDQIAALPPAPAAPKKVQREQTRDVSMSWEEIPPAKSPAVVAPPEKEKPVEKPAPVSTRKPRMSYGSPAQPVTISGRKSSAFNTANAPPSPFAPPAASSPKPASKAGSYFASAQATPAPAPANENPFASGSKPPSNSLFGSTPANASGTAKAPRLSFGTTPLGSSTPFGASTSASASKSKPFSSSTSSKPAGSLFKSTTTSTPGFPLGASRTLSASRAPNAFFNPPTPPLPRPALEHQDTDDIDAFLAAGSTQVSDRETSPAPARVENAFSEPEEEEAEPEPEPKPRIKRKSSAASKIAVAAGPKPKTRRSTIKTQHREPPSPSSSPPPRKRTTRARNGTAKAPRMSIPGAFEVDGGGDTEPESADEGGVHGHEEEEENEEEKDDLAPLPEVPSPVKRRGTRSSMSVEPTRRSSRLSVASSSPEPMTVSKSPVKGRRKAVRTIGKDSKESGSGSAGRSTRASRKR